MSLAFVFSREYKWPEHYFQYGLHEIRRKD